VPSHPRESEGEDDLPYCSHYDHVTTIHKTGVHLHFRDNWLLCSGQRFWEIAAATIEERLRIYGSKTRCFCPSVSKATRIKASLSSPSERNHARSASLTVFSPYSLRQARDEKKGTGYFFSKKKKVSTHGQNNRKSSLSPFSASMSERSVARSEATK